MSSGDYDFTDAFPGGSALPTANAGILGHHSCPYQPTSSDLYLPDIRQPRRTLTELRSILAVISAPVDIDTVSLPPELSETVARIWTAGLQLITRLDAALSAGENLDAMQGHALIDPMYALHRFCRTSDIARTITNMGERDASAHAISALHNALLTTQPEGFTCSGFTNDKIFNHLRQHYWDKLTAMQAQSARKEKMLNASWDAGDRCG